MSRNRRNQEEEGGGYSWMDTYGDLVTNLLCFFVLLYSFSAIDMKKWEELVGVFGGPSAVSVELLDEQDARKTEVIIEGIPDAVEEKDDADADREAINNALQVEYDEMFDALFNAIVSYIDEHALEAKMSAGKQGDIILVRFKEVALFDSGKAVIREEGEEVLQHVISIMSENAAAIKIIRIEGHTDNVPIHTSEFDSNWQLSMGRANAALKVFLEAGAIEMGKLSAVAYGEYQPVETNETVEGRSANRRVDFVIEKLRVD